MFLVIGFDPVRSAVSLDSAERWKFSRLVQAPAKLCGVCYTEAIAPSDEFAGRHALQTAAHLREHVGETHR